MLEGAISVFLFLFIDSDDIVCGTRFKTKRIYLSFYRLLTLKIRVLPKKMLVFLSVVE